MAEVHVPRSLAALFPGVPRRLELPAHDLACLILELDARYPGMWDRVCEPGPRLRPHINAFVDGKPATLETCITAESVVHLIPAVSGGAGEATTRRSVLEHAERIHLETLEEWRAWLEQHHARPEGVWLISWKPRTGRPAIPYEEAITEALRFGWVDSTYRSIDEERGMLWWSPRRKGSLWARTNKARVARLEAQGRMTEAGRSAVEAAKADGSWTVLEPVEDLIVPDDLATAFEARPGARERWESLPPSARRAFLLWIVTARRRETRDRRVNESAELVAQGKRLEER
jgi:uncharacterized protein YdeI (YjbR/CyaY-like superfamily)/molybdopterin converting factor small subunit